MTELSINHFKDFFRELYATDKKRPKPYPWQCRLAERAVQGEWPGAIDLPTGSGKTACIDIAVFAMACQATRSVHDRTAPRRIVFCVNRRVIVDEAYERSRKIAEALWLAEKNDDSQKPTLVAVAKCLRKLAGNSESATEVPPLDVLELRGGVYRDNRWARSAVQPTIICSTIDQIGSRLLFRGYGVSSGAAPIQAALLAYDSLVLLDEAHISEPFRQCVTSVQKYLDTTRWARESIGVKPMTFVPMTATPTAEMLSRGVIKLEDDDRSEQYPLIRRLTAQKIATLEAVDNVAVAAIKSVKRLLFVEPIAIGIIVNRVATARAIFAEFQKIAEEKPDLGLELVIGSMRPVDRDLQQTRLRNAIGPERPAKTQTSSITISTQCLEVGADYDFDYLITECASLDALRQRFGRLNRAGRDFQAKAEILIQKKLVQDEEKLVDDDPLDPIYGNALTRTWNWLIEVANDNVIDFGIDAFGVHGRPTQELLSPSANLNAPVMMPAYVDLWSQTSPRPGVDPEVSMFIHGEQQASSDIRVCWRTDLTKPKDLKDSLNAIGEITVDDWIDIVSLMPPTSAECMNVSIARFRKWVSGDDESSELESDLLAISDNAWSKKPNRNVELQEALPHDFVIWRGNKESFTVSEIGALRRLLRPGDTVVLPETSVGWNELGHVVIESKSIESESPSEDNDHKATTQQLVRIDVAEFAWREAKNHEVIRLCSPTRRFFPKGAPIDALFAAACDSNEPVRNDQWKELLLRASNAFEESDSVLSNRFSNLASTEYGLDVQYYPKRKGVILSTRRRLAMHNWFSAGNPALPAPPSLDDGNDDSSYVAGEMGLALSKHTTDVVNLTKRTCDQLLSEKLHDALAIAANLHDLGKADARFQAMLRRVSSTDAWLYLQNDDSLLAKSNGKAMSRKAATEARERADLPDGFRHELLSLLLAERSETLPEDELTKELALHAIASHHGYCRPLAPIISDPNPQDVEVRGLSVSSKEQTANPCHRFDSGIPERFWKLTREFGWWGLAFLEAILRLSDQQASSKAEARSNRESTKRVEVGADE
jgi:CRISPR-associated endonuclease/helicase Cas3